MITHKSDLENIKNELISRKLALEEKLAELSRERITDDQVQDPGDQALTSTMESVRSSLQAAETEEYQRIVRALAKIEAGTYGICIDCDQPISEKRLKSYMNAARCLVCQELFEDMAKE